MTDFAQGARQETLEVPEHGLRTHGWRLVDIDEVGADAHFAGLISG